MAKHREKCPQPETSANLAKLLYLFAEVQERLYHGETIQKALAQISRHTQDEKILETCRAIAVLLKIEATEQFVSFDRGWYFDAVQKLQKRLAWVLEKYQLIPNLVEQSDPKWTADLSQATDIQLATLTQLVSLLDNEPAFCDQQGNTIRPNDLVVVPCQDDKGREYEHYGIVRPTPNGYRIAHFFTGETIRPQNRIVEMGVGYVHFTQDLTVWQFKERPADAIDAEIEARIAKFQAEICTGRAKFWNQLSYNCEHWAREMVCGEAYSTQVEKLRKKDRD